MVGIPYYETLSESGESGSGGDWIMRLFLRVLVVTAVFVSFAGFLSPADASEIQGAWRTEKYNLKEGGRHEVEGLIFFAEKDWTVLFFVMGDDGEAKRGSGEGGSYTLEGEKLVFKHLYHLSAGEAVGSFTESPLKMFVKEASDAVTEPCRVELDGDSMTIYFPSGNNIEFRRSSR
jgi:hypothetical protein